jgi:hypothetical protein
MIDFNLTSYKRLLDALLSEGYCFQPFASFLLNEEKRAVVLRHDVDKYPERALRIAEIEAGRLIKGSYHFRISGDVFNVLIIEKIVGMGHEIAYHYEDLSRAVRSHRTSLPMEVIYYNAYTSFLENLALLRQYYPVNVISMHGDPLSPIDNRDLWKTHNYRDAGIICEPYFDIDYSNVLYLTDTGRRWNAGGSNIRDKVITSGSLNAEVNNFETARYRSTAELISSLRKNILPARIIINTHPQRWNAATLAWITEYVLQNTKNPVKRILSIIRKIKGA